jgi:biopolymer transport protein ExbD
VIVYSFLRSRADTALQEIDRYAVALLNLLDPPKAGQKPTSSLTRRSREENEAPDTDVTPMLNLMVMLIPFLLTSSEFVKIGAIELKLPESTQSGTGPGGGESALQETKLDLGVMITTKGFTLFHYFKSDSATTAVAGGPAADIPLTNGKYDYVALNQKLAEVKSMVLREIIQARFGSVPAGATLYQLYNAYLTRHLEETSVFADHESIKIVAEEAVKYETVVAVMDAARGIRTSDGNVTMFPNVAIAGGVVQ